jgi:large conductance mechanosensitive channel
MIKGFKEFILRGNVLDLAVAVVIGAAFSTVVTALVEKVFNPLIGALFNANSLATAFPVVIPTSSGGHATLYFGAVITALINFLIVAVIIYFVFVMPINVFKERAAARKAAGVPEAEDVPATELDLLAEIRDLLARAPEDTTGGKHQG